MFGEWKKFALIILAAALVIGWAATPAQAIWHVFLDENFNKDQQNPNLRWPWITDLRTRIGWHWNPQPPHLPHRPSEGNWTQYCWGIQDYIYNTHVTPHAEIRQALWCAYTNRNLIDQPRWPEDDDYMHNQNAWVWWGPVSLENAVSAVVNFWVYIDLEHYAYDSLSCVAVADPDMLTLDGAAFRRNVPCGRIFTHRVMNDWVSRRFYLDTLIVNQEDTVSLLGEEEVYIAFVWQSNAYDIAGKGAFVDDVIFAWDDGLFEITPTRLEFGYPINEDSTDWTRLPPSVDDEIKFRLSYSVRGVGETPEFSIDLYLDDELIDSHTRTAIGTDTMSYMLEADTLWAVTPGDHVLRWEVDSPCDTGGTVEEANEENNIYNLAFSVVWNPPPEFEITKPDESPTDLDRETWTDIEWTIGDTLDDYEFRVFLYWTLDTAGLAATPELAWDYIFFGRDYSAERGEGMYRWLASSYAGNGPERLPEDTLVYVVGIAADGYAGNFTVAIAPGQLRLNSVSVDEPGLVLPGEFGLVKAFPNPFNDGVSIQYALPADETVKLNIFDMSGRFVANLHDGSQTAGYHTVSWRPSTASAGVYLVRLEAAGKTALRKVVYMP